MRFKLWLFIYPIIAFICAMSLKVHGANLQALQQNAQAVAIIANFADTVQKVEQANAAQTQVPQQEQFQTSTTRLPAGACDFNDTVLVWC